MPSCHHTWRRVIVPPEFLFVSGFNKQLFLAVCSAFFRKNLHHTRLYVMVQQIHGNGKFALFMPKQSGGTITRPPYLTVKMVAAATEYYTVVVKNRSDSPFNLHG